MASPEFIDALATAISNANAGLPSHCIRFTTGKHKGRYLGWNYKSVKTKRAAMTLVRHSEHAKWAKSCKGEISILGGKFEVIAKRKVGQVKKFKRKITPALFRKEGAYKPRAIFFYTNPQRGNHCGLPGRCLIGGCLPHPAYRELPTLRTGSF